MTDVTVVVPAYNAERYIEQTLNSVLAQTFTSWELIVVDDGSSDGTSHIVGEFAARDARVTLYRQSNSGVAAARNRGLRAATLEAWAVLFLDADDVLDSEALEKLVGALERQPSVVGAHGQVQFIDADGRRIRNGEAEKWGLDRHALVAGKIIRWPSDLPTNLAVLVLLNRLRTPGCALLRRSVVDSLGGFDEDPRAAIAEDYELWLRLACRADLALLKDVVLSYRLHEHSASRNLRRTDAARWYVHRKVVHDASIGCEQRELLREGLKFARLLGCRNWFEWAIRSLRRGDVVSAAKQGRHALVELAQFYLSNGVKA
jgi:glycosyltransferase involved in cell wall biosynthesis